MTEQYNRTKVPFIIYSIYSKALSFRYKKTALPYTLNSIDFLFYQLLSTLLVITRLFKIIP